MTNIQEIMSLDVDNLRQKQLEALKQHTIEVLCTMVQHIQNGDYTSAKSMLCESPGGDDAGENNEYINFGYMTNERYPEFVMPKDIGEILTQLECLDHK